MRWGEDVRVKWGEGVRVRWEEGVRVKWGEDVRVGYAYSYCQYKYCSRFKCHAFSGLDVFKLLGPIQM